METSTASRRAPRRRLCAQCLGHTPLTRRTRAAQEAVRRAGDEARGRRGSPGASRCALGRLDPGTRSAVRAARAAAETTRRTKRCCCRCRRRRSTARGIDTLAAEHPRLGQSGRRRRQAARTRPTSTAARPAAHGSRARPPHAAEREHRAGREANLQHLCRRSAQGRRPDELAHRVLCHD